MKSVCVHAPATVANLGSGFDLIGLAIEQTADEVILTQNNTGELRITAITGDDGKLPKSIAENTCTVAIQSLLNELETKQGFDVQIHKKISFNSGLGSSASSAVAGVVAANELLGNPFTKTKLIRFALDGEYVASRGYHADNVAPCMLGRITFVHSIQPVGVVRIPFADDTHIVLLHQPVSISTAEARKLLPQLYNRKTVVNQTANFGALLTGLFTNDAQLISKGLTDCLATPYRKQLIPHFKKLEKISIRNNAMGFNISGSGPSVFAWCSSVEQAEQVKNGWSNYMHKQQAQHTIYSLAINKHGAVIT